jgi:Protein of unknown function (DUF2797)
MKYTALLTKMSSNYENPVKYYIKTENEPLLINNYLDCLIKIEFTGEINCICCGKKINKTFGQGYCFNCFTTSPETEECVFRPELCRAHLGIARDMEYSKVHCLQDHFVYLALSSDIKVGVTRSSQIPTRWIDQGANTAIKIAKTPNRYTSGLIEVSLKKYVPDKTNWRLMLTNNTSSIQQFETTLDFIKSVFPGELKEYLLNNEKTISFEYPVIQYPGKVKSVDLEKEKIISGILKGIKGQYLLFDDGKVINLRKYTGYIVNIDV